MGTKVTRNKQRSLWAPGRAAILATFSSGSKSVSLLRFRLFTCSSTRLKCSLAVIQSFSFSDVTTSFSVIKLETVNDYSNWDDAWKKFTWTVVVESYLNDFVWPFSRKTLSTLAIGGTRTSLSENADGCGKRKRKMSELNVIRKLFSREKWKS